MKQICVSDIKKELFPDEFTCLGLAASSSAVNPERYKAAADFLKAAGIHTIAEFSVDEHDVLPYLSASPEIRVRHLNNLIRNPEITAIYFLRGGFGMTHLLDDIDWDTLRERNLPVIGYSDITALHTAMTRKQAGIPVSACMALRIADDSKCQTFRRSFLRAMKLAAGIKPDAFRKISSLQLLNEYDGPVHGRLTGGNMTVFTSLCGTEYFPSCRGKIVLLEDIGEPVRKLDSYLTQLRLNGVFEHCAGVVFGCFTECNDPENLDIMLRRFASRLSVPVYKGLYFGHCARSLSFVFGEKVRLHDAGMYVQSFSERRF